MTMKLTAISGLGVKGPACFMLETQGLRLLLDLGRGPDGDSLPDLTGIGPVDAILFSHGHVDHTGGLHLAAALGNPALFAPSPTIALSLDPAMTKATPYEGLRDILGLPFLSGPCGHAPGASWMRIGGEGGLLYGGDASDESPLWRYTPPAKAQVAIFDAAYGCADEALDLQIAAIMARAVGPLLLAAPAGGRGVEMALAFHEKGHQISLCGAHLTVIDQMLDQSPDWLSQNGMARLRDLRAAACDLGPDSAAQGIMIAVGPNAERGVTAALAPRFIAEQSAEVIFTGHLAEGSPAKTMVQTGQAQFMRWNVHPTLTGLRSLIAASQPQHVLAAFCPFSEVEKLASALERPLMTQKELIW